MSELILGERRVTLLRRHGFHPALIEALTRPDEDPVARRLWASDGTVLAEIAGLPYLADLLPDGRIVPVCHLDPASVAYVLLVEDEAGWSLCWFDDHDGIGPIDSVEDFVGARLVSLWENDEGVQATDLREWAVMVGHPRAAMALAGKR